MEEYKLNLPDSWDDITLETYSKLEKAYKDGSGLTNTLEVVSILSGIEKKELQQYPSEVMEVIYEHLSFLKDSHIDPTPDRCIYIDGEKYKVHTENKLKLGEYTDAQMLLQAEGEMDYPTLMAILCRKDGEIYDDDYIADVLPERVEMFKKTPITKIMPVITFLTACSVTSPSTINRYTDHLIEVAEQSLLSLRHSKKRGIIRRLFLNWQTKKCLESLKSLKSMQPQH